MEDNELRINKFSDEVRSFISFINNYIDDYNYLSSKIVVSKLARECKSILAKENQIEQLSVYYTESSVHTISFIKVVEFILFCIEKENKESKNLTYFIYSIGSQVESTLVEREEYNLLTLVRDKFINDYLSIYSKNKLMLLIRNHYLLNLAMKHKEVDPFIVNFAQYGNLILGHIDRKINTRMRKEKSCRYLVNTVLMSLSSKDLSIDIIYPFFYQIFIKSKNNYALIIEKLNIEVEYLNSLIVKSNLKILIKKILKKSIEYRRMDVLQNLLKSFTRELLLNEYLEFLLQSCEWKENIYLQTKLQRILTEKGIYKKLKIINRIHPSIRGRKNKIDLYSQDLTYGDIYLLSK